MRFLRFVAAAAVLLAACNAPAPSEPGLPVHGVGPGSPEAAPENCDSSCARSPFLGGSSG
jgi:hypothetical protein